jgi:DNA polymerase
VTQRTPDEPGAEVDGSGALTADSAGPVSELTPAQRRDRLADVFRTARDCTACPQLAGSRTQVVFGGGNADADLMLIGEAPGAREDELGTPFVGAAGRLLDELLASVGVTRADVFVTNVLKCRPPGNRDPAPTEIARCRTYLDDQIALVRPRVIATLGPVATRALRPGSESIGELHGRVEVLDLDGLIVRLVPLYHPAAALYTRSLLDTLRDDVARLAELLARPAVPSSTA